MAIRLAHFVGLLGLLCGGLANPLRGQDARGPADDVRQATYQARPEGGSHPLTPVLSWTRQETAGMEREIRDCSATLVSRERSGGKLGNYESVFVKVRHQPFSVYAQVLTPADHKGDEALYIEGRNDGKLLAHTTGLTGKILRTVALDPNGPLAMQNQHHPITELGVLNLVRRVSRFSQEDIRYAESQVQFLRGMKVNDRVCTCIEVLHPLPRGNFHFHLLRLYIDDELKVPIRYEQYDWPKQPGGAAELVEEYTYVNLTLNNGFSDADFDPRNPRYAFP